MLDHWGGILCDIHGRIKRWAIYNDGNLVYSKGRHGAADLHYLYRHQSQETFGIQRPAAGLVPARERLCPVSAVRMAVRSSDGDAVLHAAAEHYSLYGGIAHGVILVHVALDNISKFLKEGLMKDRFNFENESFEQCEELIETPYSVNIPMRYYYKGKFRKGWTNITNCFRGTWVVGTPGSGKTFSIIEPFIRQHSAKGSRWWSMTTSSRRWPRNCTTTRKPEARKVAPRLPIQYD